MDDLKSGHNEYFLTLFRPRICSNENDFLAHKKRLIFKLFFKIFFKLTDYWSLAILSKKTKVQTSYGNIFLSWKVN